MENAKELKLVNNVVDKILLVSSGASLPTSLPTRRLTAIKRGVLYYMYLPFDFDSNNGRSALKSLKSLSDNNLLIRLNKLVKQEHNLALEILPHLLEVEDRGLHLRAGYSSLYKYCVESLGFSESTAVRRIRAARCARRFPEVFRLLEQRKIKIVDAAKIKSVISEDNEKQLLSDIIGKTQKQIDEIAAMYGQPRVVSEIVRVVKVARPAEVPHALASGRKFTATVAVKNLAILRRKSSTKRSFIIVLR